MSGRCTRRRGVPADRVERQRAGIKRLNEAFGTVGGGDRQQDSAERKSRLLAALGFGPRQRKGDEA